MTVPPSQQVEVLATIAEQLDELTGITAETFSMDDLRKMRSTLRYIGVIASRLEAKYRGILHHKALVWPK